MYTKIGMIQRRHNEANKIQQVSAPYSKDDFILNLTMTQYSCLNPAVYTIRRVVLWEYKCVCMCVCVCVCVCVYAASLQSCFTLYDPMDCIACQAPVSMGFSREEYWSGYPCPPAGDLPIPGIEPMSPVVLHCKRNL